MKAIDLFSQWVELGKDDGMEINHTPSVNYMLSLIPDNILKSKFSLNSKLTTIPCDLIEINFLLNSYLSKTIVSLLKFLIFLFISIFFEAKPFFNKKIDVILTLSSDNKILIELLTSYSKKAF